MMQVTSPAGVAMQVQIPAGRCIPVPRSPSLPAAPAMGVVEVSATPRKKRPVLQAARRAGEEASPRSVCL